MIQRIQTLFILIAIVSLGCMFVFSIASYSAESKGVAVNFDVNLSGIEFSASDENNSMEVVNLDKEINHAIEQMGLEKVFLIGKILLLSGIGVLVFILLKFKSLKLQLYLGRFVAFILILAFVALYTSADYGNDIIVNKLAPYNNQAPDFITTRGLSTFLPFVAAISLIIGTFMIKKDINLLKSTERLR